MAEDQRRLGFLGQRERATSIGPRTPIIGPLINSTKGMAIGRLASGETVTFDQKDQSAHTHIIGSTGTGKSKFIELLLRQDIRNPKVGACLIDPHGSLYDELVLYISHKCPHYAGRVILFNPAGDTNRVVGFNPIVGKGDSIDYIISSLIEACLKAWGQDSTTNTPRIAKWLENIFHTIIVNDLTLLEATPLLSVNPNANRERMIKNVQNELVYSDWLMFEKSTQTQKQSLIEGAANRLRRFLQSEIIRNVIGQREHSVDFSQAMAEGKIVLINLNGYGRVSRENMKLLGIMIVNEIFRVALLRNPLDRSLKPFHFYIDEFGQFVTRDIARALEECRKYRLFLRLAHQHLAQLREDDEYLYAAVITNCRNKVVFGGLSADDIAVMRDEIMGNFIRLKSIKDELYSTKVRHIEETRTIRSRNWGASTGTAESETAAASWNESLSEGTSQTHTESQGESYSESRSRGETDSDTVSRSRGRAKGRNEVDSHTIGEGKSWGQNKGKSFSETSGISETESFTKHHSTSEGTSETTSRGEQSTRSESESFARHHSTTQGYSENTSHNEQFSHSTGFSMDADGGIRGQSRGETMGISNGYSTGRSHGETTGTSEGRTRGTSESVSVGYSIGRSRGETWGVSEGVSRGKSQSSSAGTSVGNSIGGSTSESTGKSYGRSESETITNGSAKSYGVSRTEGESRSRQTGTAQSSGEQRSATTGRGHSEGRTTGTTQGRSEGGSETEQPFLRPEEYQEISSRTFWSLEELRFMADMSLKNQDTGYAFLKTAGQETVPIQIERVDAVRPIPKISHEKIKRTLEKSSSMNGDCCITNEQARNAIRERQKRFFGQSLNFGDVSTSDGNEKAQKAGTTDADNPFG